MISLAPKPTIPLWHICLLVGIPFVANLPILAGFSQCDPTMLYSGLGYGLTASAFPGNACYVDVTIGWITQPLGYLSAQDWLHGIIPWWNPYSGVGMPLAAEMQNESFFLPFVFLLHFKSGWLYQRIILQILTGLFTYAFLRCRHLHGIASLTGALLFALNGSFFLHAGAGSCPIFCLPLMMWGVELAALKTIKQQAGGWSLFTAGTAISIYAGFPEIAFFDGLLVAFWALIQARSLAPWYRRIFISKLTLGFCIGVALTAPLTLSFLQYLSVAQVAAHAEGFVQNSLEISAAPVLLFPYIYGGLDIASPANIKHLPGPIWVEFGGWIGFTPFLLALLSLIPLRREHIWRYGLALWVLGWITRDFNLIHISTLFNLVPGIAHADAVRFSAISVEFSAFVLAAAGIDDLLTGVRLRTRDLLIFTILLGLCVVASLYPVLPILKLWFSTQPKLKPFATVYLLLCLSFCIIVFLAIKLPFFIRLILPAIIVGAIGIFLAPQFAAPHNGKLDFQGLAALQSLDKSARLYSIGPFGPNFPARYHISEINHSQLPAPKLWTEYITNNLFSNANTIDLMGGQPEQIFGLITHLANYEAIGVKYVLAFPNQNLAHWSPSPPQTYSSNSGFVTLPGQKKISGVIITPTTSSIINSISIFIGTIYGNATGILQIKICSANQCALGSIDVGTIPDLYRANINLDHSLSITANAPLTYSISHLNGDSVSVFLTGAIGDVVASVKSGYLHTLYFEKLHLPTSVLYRSSMITPRIAPGTTDLPVVYRDNVLTIYQLPNPSAFAATSDPSCNLKIISPQHFASDCGHSATLIRRELFFPGWRAHINNRESLITRGDNIFEQVNLPAGPADIRFTYMPLHTRTASALALISLLTWIFLVWKNRNRNYIV